MNHYLKLIADIDMFSGDFSNNFCKELYFDEKSVIRIKESKSPKELEKLLQKSPLNISIEKSELNENNFYDIISKSAPFIAQRIFERKVNQKHNLKENEENNRLF